MRVVPHRTVALDVYQVPSRKVGLLRILQHPRAVQGRHFASDQRRKPRKTGDQLFTGCVQLSIEPWHQLKQGRQSLADESDVCAGSQVRFGRVAHVRAGSDHPRAALVRSADHFARGMTHLAQAHLAQEVVVILIQEDEMRSAGLQEPVIFLDPLREHGVE